MKAPRVENDAIKEYDAMVAFALTEVRGALQLTTAARLAMREADRKAGDEIAATMRSLDVWSGGVSAYFGTPSSPSTRANADSQRSSWMGGTSSGDPSVTSTPAST